LRLQRASMFTVIISLRHCSYPEAIDDAVNRRSSWMEKRKTYLTHPSPPQWEHVRRTSGRFYLHTACCLLLVT
jgi:hypothetical protein